MTVLVYLLFPVGLGVAYYCYNYLPAHVKQHYETKVQVSANNLAIEQQKTEQKRLEYQTAQLNAGNRSTQ